MFVKNLTKDVLAIRKSGNVLKLQPGMNCVDETKWSADYILSVYGNKYITIINRDVEELEEITPVEDVKPVEQPQDVPADTDDVKEGTPVETPVEQHTEGGDAPTEEQPTDEAPVEDKPAEDKSVETPVEDKPAEEQKPKRNAKNTSKKANQ